MRRDRLNGIIKRRSEAKLYDLIASNQKKYLNREQFIKEWFECFKFEPLDPFIPEKLEIILGSIQQTFYQYIRDNYIKFHDFYRDKYNLVEAFRIHEILPKGPVKKRQVKRKIPQSS